ncbi:MAG: P-II family nitrogen regulator [Candidatus Nezhaarchaeales archaeon]
MIGGASWIGFNDVNEALAKTGFRPMTVTSVKGRGRQMGLEFDFRGRKFRIGLIPKSRWSLKS